MHRHAILMTVLLALFALTQPSFAAVLTVTVAADSGAGSLREAITTANGNGVADEIVFSGNFTISLSSQLPTITSEITITGNGWQNTIISGGDQPGVSNGVKAFRIDTGGILVLDGVSLNSCYTSTGGGAVSNNGGVFRFKNSWAQSNRADYGGWLENYKTAEIEGSTVVGNSSLNSGAPFGGGAIYSSGSADLRITDSAVAENNSPGVGGSVCVANGTLFAERTLLEGASAAGDGGALYFDGDWLRLANVTVTNNSADRGGGLYLAAGADNQVTNLTVTDNDATTAGGGVFVGAATLEIRHSIVAGNPGGNCSGTLSSTGYNIDDASSCGFTQPTDMPNTDPMLGPYTWWDSGRTYYHPLLPGSPAIDAADPAGCTWDDDASPGTAEVLLTADQRGVARPQDGDYNGTPISDIGAIEWGAIFMDGFESGNTIAWQ